ncbi:YbdD/YjiX family protein [Arenimonas daejeonensis]|uniref:YbdD/YjiX family protein n=1 Tax=Arenimonas daejeonensis TaxID=370777 RepID=UPI0011BEC25D|nr:YbdD/YjiX family protein [Arenimonas daejeonensis]
MQTVDLRNFWQRTMQTARLMVGLPDYARYAAHVREKHPDRKPMTETEFFRACQQSRYGGRNGRCC